MPRVSHLLPVLAIPSLIAAVGPAGAGTLLPDFSRATFVPGAVIDNPYLPYIVGSRNAQVAEGVEDGEPFEERDVQKVLGAGPKILGVRTTTVLDRAFEDGLLVEQTRDYYAQDTDGNVWYMGEDVKNFEYDDEGNLIDTNSDSTWRAGVHKARPGWAMPAEQIIGQKYFQEYAPLDDALDEGQTYAILKELKVGSVVYAKVLQVFETHPCRARRRRVQVLRARCRPDPGRGGSRRKPDEPRARLRRVAPAAIPLPPGLLLLGERPGRSVRAAPASDHDDLGAHADAVVEVDHVLVQHPEAAGRGGPSDALRRVGAVDAEARVLPAEVDVERPRAERVVTPPGWPSRHFSSDGSRSIISGGGVQRGQLALRAMVPVPVQPKPSRPMAMP